MKKIALWLRATLVSAVIVSVFTFGAQAGPLVQNGGFETSDFSGWTQIGDTGYTGVTSSADTCPGGVSGTLGWCAPHSGTYAAFFGPTSSLGGISQLLPTAAGATYDLDFWLVVDVGVGGPPNEFKVSWNGVAITDVVNAPAAPWTHYAWSGLTATGSSTELKFEFRNPPDWFGLDDVRVEAVPEPVSLALTGLGLLAVFSLGRFARRRR